MGCVSLMRAASPQKLSLTLALLNAYSSAFEVVLPTLFFFFGTWACVALAAAVLIYEVVALCNDVMKVVSKLVKLEKSGEIQVGGEPSLIYKLYKIYFSS